jgi:hypothetical protein
MGALYKGLIVSGVLAIIAFYPLAGKFMGGVAAKAAAKGAAGFVIPTFNIFLLAVIGVALTGLIVAITEYFTSKSFNPVKSIALASTTGHGTNVIQGLAMSMKSTAAPVIVIVAAILAAFHLGGGLAHPGTGLYAIALTAVAMLRPQMVRDYRYAADIFMIDPYPVPHMPMTWLSDCIEEAARYVPKERLWAVIQAFGGGKHSQDGWPRRPQKVEMRCLTYLAVVHGAHGIFYFSYPEVSSDPASWEGLQRIVKELQDLQPWLALPNLPSKRRLEIISPFKVDAAGQPAVHFCEKQQGREHLLILVNVIDRPVSFYLHGFSGQVNWLEEKFGNQKSVVQDGNIRTELGPYEVRIYHFTLTG